MSGVFVTKRLLGGIQNFSRLSKSALSRSTAQITTKESLTIPSSSCSSTNQQQRSFSSSSRKLVMGNQEPVPYGREALTQATMARRQKLQSARRLRKLGIMLGSLTGVGGVTYLALQYFEDSLQFYLTPTELLDNRKFKKFVENGTPLRLGGLVTEGSVVKFQSVDPVRAEDPKVAAMVNKLTKKAGAGGVTFEVHDYLNKVDVEFYGGLPELFQEGKSVIAHGTLQKKSKEKMRGEEGEAEYFMLADEILAKHDENYVPKEFKEKLKTNREMREMKLKAAEKEGRVAVL
eukprot:Nk52_evm9s163 gene=Nk52_evmTU9s163